jgi:hypothetical protein
VAQPNPLRPAQARAGAHLDPHRATALGRPPRSRPHKRRLPPPARAALALPPARAASLRPAAARAAALQAVAPPPCKPVRAPPPALTPISGRLRRSPPMVSTSTDSSCLPRPIPGLLWAPRRPCRRRHHRLTSLSAGLSCDRRRKKEGRFAKYPLSFPLIF